MSKKRVYELAKELGMENKDLIAKLERIGIAVKSHSSTLEEHDIERILQELKAGEPAGMEEKRIKSTVIRRRAVRPAVEEVPVVPETPPAEPVAEKAKEAPVKEAPQKEAAPAAVAVVVAASVGPRRRERLQCRRRTPSPSRWRGARWWRGSSRGPRR